MIHGRYVKTFAEATHALPQDMHLNADYPFKLPVIVAKEKNYIVIKDREETTVRIVRRNGREYAFIEQSSSMEIAFRYEPSRFKLLPFRDTSTAMPVLVQNVMDDLLGNPSRPTDSRTTGR